MTEPSRDEKMVLVPGCFLSETGGCYVIRIDRLSAGGGTDRRRQPYGMRYYDSFTMAYWTFLIAGSASLFLADWPTLLPALAEPRTGLAALGFMVVGTALPFTLYNKGLETVESGKRRK